MSPSGKLAVNIAWSWPGTILLLLLLLFPVYGPLMSGIDGALLPVTTKIKFIDATPVEGGLSVRLQFTKLRDCEFLGLSADRDGVSVPFDPITGGLPITLPTGERLSRTWLIGTTDLEGIRIRWVHRCNPWWTTVTVGYP